MKYTGKMTIDEKFTRRLAFRINAGNFYNIDINYFLFHEINGIMTNLEILFTDLEFMIRNALVMQATE